MLLTNFVIAETTFFDNPDDAFIMGDYATGEVGGTTTGGGGCLTNWACSDWSFCNNGMQIRNCTKEKAYCYADLKTKPVENQSCSIGNQENKNNTGSGEGINNSPTGNENLSSYNVKTIILGILITVVAGFIILYKRHKKRKYFRYRH